MKNGITLFWKIKFKTKNLVFPYKTVEILPIQKNRSQQAHDVIMTYQRRRRSDIILTSCACWDRMCIFLIILLIFNTGTVCSVQCFLTCPIFKKNLCTYFGDCVAQFMFELVGNRERSFSTRFQYSLRQLIYSSEFMRNLYENKQFQTLNQYNKQRISYMLLLLMKRFNENSFP